MTEDKKVSAHRRHDHESEGTGITSVHWQKTETITAAAKELFIFPTPALSIYINNLEKVTLGRSTLFCSGWERTVILTYAGEQYVERTKLFY